MTEFDSLTDDPDLTQEASDETTTTDMDEGDISSTPLFCSPVLDRIRTSD